MPLHAKVWAGTAETYNVVTEGLAKAQAHLAEAGDSRYDMRPIWSKQDGVAVVEISGSLCSGSAGVFGQMFGVLGYDDIRKAVVEAVTDPEVKSIMLHVSSGGGAVAGVDDLSKFIAKVAKLKPVAVYTDNMMASAAYWLASGATTIMASNTALVGSLGVLSVHVERSAQLKADGVAATIIRAGKYKALANSIEPLTEDAIAGVQAQVDGLYSIFMQTVAAGRDVPVSVADSQMGQGREFLGKDALAAGLVDKIVTYDQAVAETKKLDTSATVMNNAQKSKGTNMKANLTEAQLAALAAGATLEAVAATATANVTVAETVAEVAAPATEAVTELAAESVAGNASAFAEPSAVTLLKDQLTAAQASLLAVSVEAAGLKAQVAANSPTHEGLLAIARTAMANMLVPLGGSAVVAASMDAATIIAQYPSTKEAFFASFKVGGVAATAQADKKPDVQISGYELAMIQAANGK